MSFLDNPKNAGFAMWAVGIIQMVLAIVSIAYVFIDNKDILLVVPGIGALIGGFIYFGFGNSVRTGAISEKWDILCVYVKTVGVVAIIAGIFGLLPLDLAVGGVVSIIIGLIILFIYKKMTDGNATTFDKIIWILLVLIFLIGIIGGLLSIISFTIDGVLLGLCDVVIYAFMFLALFDSDVKAKMGM
ncbi:MAG: hypothetical protein MJZ38_00970 [archaeon]|nr:hypothetical protein [archaeon]